MRQINYIRVELVPSQLDASKPMSWLKIEVIHSGKEKVSFEHFIESDDFESVFDTIMDMAKEVIKREVNK